MTWTNTRNASTLIVEDIRCRVWRTKQGTWTAVVSDRGRVMAAYDFATAGAAKAWCEEQVAKAR